jgi:hypothetical protein
MEKEFITITGSYSENISPENYGLQGMRFENRSFFLSANENLSQEEATPEKIKEIGNKLHALCKAVVKESARVEIRELKKAAGLIIEPMGDEYKAIADIIVLFESSVTSEDVKKATDTAKERKGVLNEVQLDYLNTIKRKAEARALN